MVDVDQVRDDLWKRIRKYQEAGGSVRNEPMAIRFGGERGFFIYGSSAGVGSPACIIGVVQATEGTTNAVTDLPKVLGITARDVTALECGFEGWTRDDLRKDGEENELVDSPFYLLGQEIAQKLEEEAAAEDAKGATT